MPTEQKEIEELKAENEKLKKEVSELRKENEKLSTENKIVNMGFNEEDSKNKRFLEIIENLSKGIAEIARG